MFSLLKRFLTASIRRQLILAVALVHALLMTLFIYDLVERQRDFLHEQSVRQALSLSAALAGNSTAWVLANDVVGLEEVIRALAGYPDLRYAMVLNRQGEVLAHSRRELAGKYVADGVSRGLLDAPPQARILVNTPTVIDVAAPILRGAQPVGWARVSLGQESSAQGLRLVTRNGLIYALIAIAVGTLFAYFMAQGLTRGLYHLLEIAEATRQGRRDRRAETRRADEIGQLAQGFDRMLDALKSSEDELRELNQSLEQRVQERTAELEAARLAAESANRAKSIFLANMSHELRTPLNAILGFSELIAHNPTLPESERENLEIIRRSGEHLLSLINDVLDMSKIEAGKTSLEEEDCDLYRLLQDIADMIRPRAARKGLDFTAELAPNLARYIRVDPAKLRQVLLNLLGNAVKYTDRGGVVLRARSLENAPNRRLECEIEDSGRGIPPEEQDKLFEPFSQASSSRGVQEGTGLGLAISSRHVQLMGGEISLQSEVGRGTLFRFSIPVRAASGKIAEAPAPPQRVIGLAPGQPDYRVLVVDDAAETRLLLQKFLRGVGFEVREARDGEEALAIFQAWPPHFVWMDLRMTGMDGYQVTRRIRAGAAGRTVKIVALSASVFKDEQEKILAAGCDDFLRKPFRENELFEMLAKHLGVRYRYQESPAPAPAAQVEPAALRALPDSLRGELTQALLALNTHRIERAVAAIAAQSPALGRGLQSLADDFQYERLLALLEGNVEGNPAKRE
jgi:signal transduction histidine kinase/CheY-like chemotaxis protein